MECIHGLIIVVVVAAAVVHVVIAIAVAIQVVAATTVPAYGVDGAVAVLMMSIH